MAVTAADVKKLREKTGAGMMDVKKALEEADGDFARAERILKELGKATAAKRSGRATNEGRIFAHIGGDTAALVELACETDFVARNETFVALGNQLAADAVARALDAPDEDANAKVQDAISTIKENMSFRRVSRLAKEATERFSSYIHGDTGRLGSVVKVKVERPELLEKQEVIDFAFDCALHTVAFRPLYLSSETVDEAYRTEQEEIFTKQVQNMGKPEKVLQGIVQGKLRKHYSEVCLLDQGFVKDEKTAVRDVAKALSKQVGGTVTVSGFLVFAVGEDI